MTNSHYQNGQDQIRSLGIELNKSIKRELADYIDQSSNWLLARIYNGSSWHIWPTSLTERFFRGYLTLEDVSLCGLPSRQRTARRSRSGGSRAPYIVEQYWMRSPCHTCLSEFMRLEMARLTCLAEHNGPDEPAIVKWHHYYTWHQPQDIGIRNAWVQVYLTGQEADPHRCRAAVPGELGWNLRQCKRKAVNYAAGYGFCDQHYRLISEALESKGQPAL